MSQVSGALAPSNIVALCALQQWLTSDPSVAAGQWQINDAACAFPSGEYWTVDAGNVRSWYRHKFSDHFDGLEDCEQLGDPWLDELFALRLDLLYFAERVDDPRWLEPERSAALVGFLRPGREHWGTLLPEAH